MATHELKTWSDPFAAILSGAKTHEIRKADRDYQVGDRLVLQEYVPGEPTFSPGLHEPGYLQPCYTGRSIIVEVTYITRGGERGIPDGMCVMSIRKAATERPPLKDDPAMQQFIEERGRPPRGEWPR